MDESHFNATFIPGSTGSSGFPETFGSSGWAGTPAKEKIITITNRNKLRKIKVKEEKVEPEWTEVNPSPVFEMALRIAKNSFYGILGIKVKETNPSAVSGKIKKIK